MLVECAQSQCQYILREFALACLGTAASWSAAPLPPRLARALFSQYLRLLRARALCFEAPRQAGRYRSRLERAWEGAQFVARALERHNESSLVPECDNDPAAAASSPRVELLQHFVGTLRLLLERQLQALRRAASRVETARAHSTALEAQAEAQASRLQRHSSDVAARAEHTAAAQRLAELQATCLKFGLISAVLRDEECNHPQARPSPFVY